MDPNSIGKVLLDEAVADHGNAVVAEVLPGPADVVDLVGSELGDGVGQVILVPAIVRKSRCG